MLAAHEPSIRSLLRLTPPGDGFTPTAHRAGRGQVTVELDTAAGIDVAAERRRLDKDLPPPARRPSRPSASWPTTSFLAKAPAEVVAKTRDRLAAATADIERISGRLAALPGRGTRLTTPDGTLSIEEELREAEREILARRPEHAIEPTLDRIADLVALLGDPQRAYPVIHVTGTNGKTSTARMIECAAARPRACAPGCSPARTCPPSGSGSCVDGEPVSAERFVAAYDELAPYLALVDGQQASPAVLLRGADRRWRSPSSPTSRWTSRSSRSAWAAPGTRPTSPTARSPWSPRSPWTTPATWATRSRRSRRRRPASSSRARSPCWPSSRCPRPRCCCAGR